MRTRLNPTLTIHSRLRAFSQKLCLANKAFGQQNLGTSFFCQKNYFGQKKCWPKKVLAKKLFGKHDVGQINRWPKECLIQKLFGQKNAWPKRYTFWLIFFFGENKSLGQKHFGKTNVCPKVVCFGQTIWAKIYRETPKNGFRKLKKKNDFDNKNSPSR